MSTLSSLLQSELSALSNESRRKNPEIKDACEKVIMIIRTAKDRANFSEELTKTEETLKPIYLACNTKNPKWTSIAMGCLQRLIVHRAVPETTMAPILKMLSEILTINSEVQLKVLQTVLPLVTNYDCIRGELLNTALLICFKLQESKVPMVNNTAAATLRQLVIVTFDKKITLTSSDHIGVDLSSEKGSSELDVQALVSSLSPDAKDAYFLFQDLCYMTGGETPILLKLPSLNRSFGLELIESVLTNQPQVFLKYPEFTCLLKEKLCSIVIRTFSEKGDFPQTVRVMRIVFLIIRLFNEALPTEVEIFVSMLIKILETEGVLWHRVLAAEVIRGICSNQELLKSIYKGYDKNSSYDGASNLFREIIRVLGKVVQENPLQFRSSSLRKNISEVSSGSYSLADPGLFTTNGALMRVQCIDQLDKTDAPSIPEGYILLLILISTEAIVSGLCQTGIPNIKEISAKTEESSNNNTSLDISSLKLGSEASLIKEMVDLSWTGILATLSFLVKLPMDEELTLLVVNALKQFTLLCGVFDIIAPRDAFLGCLYRNAFPHVASYETQSTDSFSGMLSSGTFSGSNLSSTNSQVLTERHVIFLKAILEIAQQLSEVLDDSWFLVLDALQHVQHLLQPDGKMFRNSSNVSKEGLSDLSNRELIQEIRRFFEDIKYLNDASFASFLKCLTRLAVESSGSIFISEFITNEESTDQSGEESTETTQDLSSRGVTLNRGLFKLEENLFSIEQLKLVCLSTMPRLINQSSAYLWNLILNNLINIANGIATAPGVRNQTCESIADILITGMNCANSLRLDSHKRIQFQMLNPLARWMGLPKYGGGVLDRIQERLSPHVSVQKAAIETLDKLLQNSGHSFTFGWNIIFDMLLSACPAHLGASPSVMADQQATDANSESQASRTSVKLVRIAFPCLQLICTDFLAPLPPSCLRDCVLTVGRFGMQEEDLNTSLTAIGMLWNVLDYIQKRLDSPLNDTPLNSENNLIDFHAKFHSESPDSSSLRQLQLLTLEQLAFICADPRPEVRNGAIQTLFRTITANGSVLPVPVWNSLIWKILFPLLDSVSTIYCNLESNPENKVKERRAGSPDMMFHHSRNTAKKQWDETRVLILGGLANVFRDFLVELVKIPDFSKVWDTVLTHIVESALSDSPEVSLASLRSLNKLLSNNISINKISKELVIELWKMAWIQWRDLGQILTNENEIDIKITSLITPLPSQTEGEVITALAVPHHALKLRRVDQSILTCYIESFIPIFEKLGLAGFLDNDWNALLTILYEILCYSFSQEYPLDIESPSPLQNAILKLLEPLLNANSHQTLPLILLRTLPDFCLLAYTESDHITALKKPRYVSLCCSILNNISDLLISNVSLPALYYDKSTIRRIFNMLANIIKPKYDGPNTGSREIPLWKMATAVLNKSGQSILKALDDSDLNSLALSSFVSSYIDVLEILFEKQAPPLEMTVSELEVDERFEIDSLVLAFRSIIPSLHHPEAPEELLLRVINVLQSVSMLEAQTDLQSHSPGPSTPYTFLSKEQLAFASLRCLICLCMDADERKKLVEADTHDDADPYSLPPEEADFLTFGHRAIFEVVVPARVAHLASPVLMTRCLSVLTAFAQDIPLFGKRPLPRVRRDEILFLLRHLGDLNLPPDSCHHLLPPAPSAPLRAVVTEELLRSPAAHLFLLYPLLCQILWCRDSAIVGRVACCLQRIGQELGLGGPQFSLSPGNSLLPYDSHFQ